MIQPHVTCHGRYFCKTTADFDESLNLTSHNESILLKIINDNLTCSLLTISRMALRIGKISSNRCGENSEYDRRGA